MPRDPKDFIDWSGHQAGQPEHPLSKPLEKTGKGKEVTEQQFTKTVAETDPRRIKLQPTDEEMFGHLVSSPEQVAKMEAEWHDRLNNWHKTVTKPVEKKQTTSWGRGPIHKEQRSEEELRISQIPVQGSDTPDD